MIYLIGGPPRCGKTTLAKTFSKQAKIPWISSDTLEVVAGEYMTQEEWDLTHPYSIAHTSNNTFYAEFTAKEIVTLIKAQSIATESAIQMTALCSIKDEIDYIIEGYHITPKFAAKLIKKYGAHNIKAVFLAKTDAQKFVAEAVKNPVTNDWLIKKDTKPETIAKVGEMIALYSNYFEAEAARYKLPVFAMDKNFTKSISEIVKILGKKK